MRRPINGFSCYLSIPSHVSLSVPKITRESWSGHADTQPLSLQAVQEWPSISRLAGSEVTSHDDHTARNRWQVNPSLLCEEDVPKDPAVLVDPEWK
jgi:hypothetical protein